MFMPTLGPVQGLEQSTPTPPPFQQVLGMTWRSLQMGLRWRLLTAQAHLLLLILGQVPALAQSTLIPPLSHQTLALAWRGALSDNLSLEEGKTRWKIQ
jgi:hypothetical protein